MPDFQWVCGWLRRIPGTRNGKRGAPPYTM
jgi:hypothetical protein